MWVIINQFIIFNCDFDKFGDMCDVKFWFVVVKLFVDFWEFFGFGNVDMENGYVEWFYYY